MRVLRCTCLALFLLLPHASAEAQQALRIHGSNTIGERLAPALVDAWLASRNLTAAGWSETAPLERETRTDELRIELHSHGSNTGIRALLDGRADVAMASRPINSAEVADAHGQGLGRLDQPAHEFVIALDGLAIIVHPDNPVRSLDMPQLRRIFTGEITRWSQVGGPDQPIRALARDDQSGTYDTFRSLVLAGSQLARGTPRYESTSELAAAVAADPGAIGFAGVGGIGQARALAISDTGTRPLSPQLSTVAVEDYLLTRRLYLYLRADAHSEAIRFAHFAVGDAAQDVVERIGFVAQTIRAVPVALPDNAPNEYRDLVRGTERLSLNFRFGTGRSLLDSRAERDLTRLVRYMRDQEEGGQRLRLILLGFADASETLPYLALTLANDRVDYVTQQLVDRGVPVMRARGIGSALPVAANDSDWGRYKNRRVEVWLTGRANEGDGAGAP